MDSNEETIELLDNLIFAMEELNRIMDSIEEWSEVNLTPINNDTASP